jgi:hypothetical protein
MKGKIEADAGDVHHMLTVLREERSSRRQERTCAP